MELVNAQSSDFAVYRKVIGYYIGCTQKIISDKPRMFVEYASRAGSLRMDSSVCPYFLTSGELDVVELFIEKGYFTNFLNPKTLELLVFNSFVNKANAGGVDLMRSIRCTSSLVDWMNPGSVQRARLFGFPRAVDALLQYQGERRVVNEEERSWWKR